MRSNGQDTVFSIYALWPWPWRYDLRSRSWHTIGTWTTIVGNIIQIKHGIRSYDPDKDFGYVCTVTLTLEIWPWTKVMKHHWVMDNNLVRYYPDPTRQWGVMVWAQIFSICALWPWRYDLRSRSWRTLGTWTIIVWKIIQIQLGSVELWPGHRFLVYVYCDLDWPFLKFMTHSWVMDNSCVKYYPDPTWQWGVMAWTRILGMCALSPWPWRYILV